MKLLPPRGLARFLAAAAYVVIVLAALVLVFEFVVNQRLLPANF